MITLKSCPVCDSYQITPFQQAGFAPYVTHEIMPGVNVEAAIVSRYSTCQNCHVIFQNPRLSDKELVKFYSGGTYRRTLNLTNEEIDKDEAHRANVDVEIIKKYIGFVKSHLDIGCGSGHLLRGVGAKTKVGVETDEARVEVKDLKLYPEIDSVSQKSFDLVTAIHVLEHVSKPLNFLKKMAKFVGKDGYLIIEVPTWKSPGGPLRLAHLYHFEPDVLRFMCKQVGLRVEYTEFTPHLMLICQR